MLKSFTSYGLLYLSVSITMNIKKKSMLYKNTCTNFYLNVYQIYPNIYPGVYNCDSKKSNWCEIQISDHPSLQNIISSIPWMLLGFYKKFGFNKCNVTQVRARMLLFRKT